MRVIYVEDNIANVHLVKRVARMGKHEIINYIDGMDALNNFETDKADLVLMDIQLAGELTGIEVVKKLRDKGYTTPIFAVTAYAMIGDKERCMEAGCTGYMSKPIPIPDLVKLFQQYDKPKPATDTEQTDKQVSESSETATMKTPAPTTSTEETSEVPKVKPSAKNDEKQIKKDSVAKIAKSADNSNLPKPISKDKPAEMK